VLTGILSLAVQHDAIDTYLGHEKVSMTQDVYMSRRIATCPAGSPVLLRGLRWKPSISAVAGRLRVAGS